MADTPETIRLISYPTDQQRADIKRTAWSQMLNAMTYHPETRSYSVSMLALAAAGIPVEVPRG